jgi:hypothetical protein
MAIPKSTVNAEPGTPGTANFSNLHKPQAAHRGFVPRGLSYAKRRPKLFTNAERPLWSVRRRQADVRRWKLSTRGSNPKRSWSATFVTAPKARHRNATNDGGSPDGRLRPVYHKIYGVRHLCIRVRTGWAFPMRLVLIVAVLLLVAVSGGALVPAAEPIRPYLSEATLALAVLVLILVFLQPRQKAPLSEPLSEPAAEPARPVAAQPVAPDAGRVDAEIVHFLAMLQQKGRLIDFLMDDIHAYSDAQVGAAARVVHAGCKGVLQEHFRISPVRTEPEGSRVQVPAGYSADEYRLVGRIAGSAPFSGVLVHGGWKTNMVKLPQLLRGAADRLPAIAPAEVEVK